MSKKSKLNAQINAHTFARCSDIVKINAILDFISSFEDNSVYQIKRDMNTAWGIAPNTTGKYLSMLENAGVVKRKIIEGRKGLPKNNFIVVDGGFKASIKYCFEKIYKM